MDDDDSLLEEIVDDFFDRMRSDNPPNIEDYCTKHPDRADEIRDLLSSIQLMEKFSDRESDFRDSAHAKRKSLHQQLKQLGDFDVVREIGRGGMGVVYEAVDRTLQRRVALKVLHDSALATQKHVDRFRRESQLAAQLHHTNIVSVFGVGQEDGSHFYAMQFIDGVSLHDILCGFQAETAIEPHSDINDGLKIAQAFQRGGFADSWKQQEVSLTLPSKDTSVKFGTDRSADRKPPPVAQQTQAFCSDSTFEPLLLDDLHVEESGESVDPDNQPDKPAMANQLGPKYWRSVARIGVQVADALHHAHSYGILHRDIKPANLLLDEKGTVWVADFGLAKLNEYDDLTKTGDVVGTLKYMAPE